MNAVLMTLAQANGGEVHLTVAGAVIMVLCVGLVLGLNVFCMFRILGGQEPDEYDRGFLDGDA